MTFPNTIPQNQINLPNNRAQLVDKDSKPTAEWQKWFTNVQIVLNTYSNIAFGDAIPDPAIPAAPPQIVFNNAPTAGGKIGWVCVSAGPPAVWKEWGPIDA